MSENPYRPPKAEVSDVTPKEPFILGRAAWFYLPVFLALLPAMLLMRQAIASAAASWGLWAGLIATAGLIYVPVRSLLALSDRTTPWSLDVAFYATLAVFLGGMVTNDANLIVAGMTPVFLISGILGCTVLLVEKRHGVRVYASARRYFYRSNDAL